MAMTKCRECGNAVSEGASKCPHCGISDPSKLAYVLKLVLGVGFSIFVLWFLLSGKGAETVQQAANSTVRACKVTDINGKPEIFVINGETDWGIRVDANVTKMPSRGNVKVVIEISSSEGDLKKERTVLMDENQSSVVTLQFPELTVNATNIEMRGSCST